MSKTFKIKNGDVIISSVSGRPSIISDDVKIRQDIQEFFTVEIQPNGFGAGIEQLIGLVESSTDMYISLVYRNILNGINAMIALQNSNLKISRPKAELIAGVGYLNVQSNPTDKTNVYFNVNITTKNGVNIPTQISNR